MMRIKLVIFGLAFLIISCQNRSSKQQVSVGSELPEASVRIDTLSQIERIDKKSLKDTVIDVLQHFTETELPNIYRLGGVVYQPYLLDDRLAKIDLIFEGDRETLTKSYYFNERGEIFYVNRSYSIYAPPKWEEGSKEISVTKSGYFILNDSVRKSVGENIVEEVEITNGIDKVMQLNKEL